jgi:hypothetical protein
MTHAPDVTRVGKLRPEARLIIDARGQIRDANDAAHHLLDYRAGTLIGLSLAWIMPPTRHTVMGDLIEAFKQGARRSLPGVLMRDNGSLILVTMTTHPCTGPRGQELALSLELDEEPASGVQRGGTSRASAAAVLPSTLPPPAPPAPRGADLPSTRVQSAARTPRHGISPSRPTRLSARPLAPTPATRRATAPAHSAELQRREVTEQLEACTELLCWLDGQLQRPSARESARDRAFARVVVREASQLIARCQNALRSEQSSK